MKMKIEIEVEKVVNRGSKQLKVLKIVGLDCRYLPTCYVNENAYWISVDSSCGESNIYANDKTFNGGTSVVTILSTGRYYDKKYFEKVMKYVARAARELKRINKELEEENKNWKGSKTYTI